MEKDDERYGEKGKDKPLTRRVPGVSNNPTHLIERITEDVRANAER